MVSSGTRETGTAGVPFLLAVRHRHSFSELSGMCYGRGSGLTERTSGFGQVSGSTDVFDAVRAIHARDLLISADSMRAHLAGAFGPNCTQPNVSAGGCGTGNGRRS